MRVALFEYVLIPSADAPPPTFKSLFRRFSHATADAVGRPWTFLIAVLVVVSWAASGPLFHFSDTWQLVINTGTTVVTFLMVFLIQNTQNRDAHAIHLKLDELIRANSHARNGLVALEQRSDEELAELESEFEKLRDHVKNYREKREAHPRRSRRRTPRTHRHHA